MKREPSPAVEIGIETTERYMLRASVWCHEIPSGQCSLGMTDAATSVCSRYYARFAALLHEKGLGVLTRNYCGIGILCRDNSHEFNADWIIGPRPVSTLNVPPNVRHKLRLSACLRGFSSPQATL